MSRIPLSITLALLVVAVVATSLSAGQIEPGFGEYLQTLDAGTHVRAIIKMRDQVSLPTLEASFRHNGAAMAERHTTVITGLHDVARESQPALLGLLNGAKGSGEVREFRSFWISNLVALEAVPAFLFTLAEREDIDTIYEDAPIEAIQPVSSGPVGEAARGVEPGVEATGAPTLWAMGITGVGALACHLDTGVSGTHPALADRWRGLDAGVSPQEAWFDPVTNTTFPFDSGSHGTHTMGTILGKDGDDIIGMAYGAKWISAGVIDRVSISQTLTDAIAAFEWAADPDGDPGTTDDVPDVISNSWGLSPLYHGYPACSDAGLWGVIDNVEAAGAVVVFAAGNEGSGSVTLRIPADRDTTPVNSFAVGALNQGAATIAGFSSRGPSGCPTASIKPEVCAVGVDVRSSVGSSGYSTMSGTSMACPHVAGAVVLLRQVNPEATVEDIKYALYYTAVDLGPAGEDNDYGMGKIDVVAAAEYVGLGSLGTLTGTVTAASGGAPLPARLTLSGDFDFQATAGADGTYMLKIPSGKYDLEAWMFGYLPETVSIAVGEGDTVNTDFALDLAPMATLEGTVTNLNTGLPEAGVSIKLVGTPQSAVTTNASGFYQDTTVPSDNTYTISASKEDFLTAVEEDVFVASGGTTVLDFDIEPVPYAQVEVYVISSRGREVNDAEVRVYNAWEEYEDYTDRDGYVLFDKVVGESTYTVRSSKPGIQWDNAYQYGTFVPGGVTTRIDLEMDHGCFTKAAAEGTALEQKIETLQDLRTLMTSTEAGRRYVDLYQEHTFEISWLLFIDGQLRNFAREAIWAILPETERILAGENDVILAPNKAALLDEILGAFEAAGSRSLRGDIAELRLELENASGRDLQEILNGETAGFGETLIQPKEDAFTFSGSPVIRRR